ncbi:hypothetical protein DFH09DRAFT_926166, partial [Mycena vulgaris]
MLLYIKGALPPQEIRNRLMNPGSEFEKSLIEYLETVHVGEFHNGDLISGTADSELQQNDGSTYQNPTLTMPVPPPKHCKDTTCSGCQRCSRLALWWTKFWETTDDLMLKSNVHTQHQAHEPTAKERRAKVTKGAKVKYTGSKGCRNKEGICMARFPRETFAKSVVDYADGSLSVKKLESKINNVTPMLTYCVRCNTDVASLLSGTATKAIIAYISDYVSKASLKSYQVFSSMYDILHENADPLSAEFKRKDKCRRLLMKIVNALSTKMEIGSPMASMYLLQNPDHYTSHKFTVFWWRNYVSEVRRAWHKANLQAGGLDNFEESSSDHESSDDEIDSDFEQDGEEAFLDKVVLTRANKKIIGASAVDDYKHRSEDLSHMSLYEWIQCAQRVKRTPTQAKRFSIHTQEEPGFQQLKETICEEEMKDSHLVSRPFSSDHPLYLTHYSRIDKTNVDWMVPNFVGGSLPRRDAGDREYYCCTMLTLFKPWRSGIELKETGMDWATAYALHNFTPRASQLMNNFNIRYECNDARDDHYAQLKRKTKEARRNQQSAYLGDEDDDLNDFDGVNEDIEADENGDGPDYSVPGPLHRAQARKMNKMKEMMTQAEWLKDLPVAERGQEVRQFRPDEILSPSRWRAVISQLRESVLGSKLQHLPSKDLKKPMNQDPDKVQVLESEYFSRKFRAELCEAHDLIDATVVQFTLNRDQERAFRIVANHA